MPTGWPRPLACYSHKVLPQSNGCLAIKLGVEASIFTGEEIYHSNLPSVTDLVGQAKRKEWSAHTWSFYLQQYTFTVVGIAIPSWAATDTWRGNECRGELPILLYFTLGLSQTSPIIIRCCHWHFYLFILIIGCTIHLVFSYNCRSVKEKNDWQLVF